MSSTEFPRHLALVVACLATWWFVSAERATAACVPVPYGVGGIGVDFVQFWPGDGNAYDVLGFNHGVLRNGATYTPGKVGHAFSFDGLNDFVELTDDNNYASGPSRFTIEFWVRFDSVEVGTLAAPGTIFLGNDEGPGNRDKWFFGHGGGQLFFHVNTSTGPPRNLAQAAFNPVTNQWYHLAVIRGFASTYKIYINGVEAGSEVDTQEIPPTIASLTLGQAGNTGFLEGQLDEVTLYAYSLTLSELQSIVNAGADGKCRTCTPPPSNLTNWWPGNGNALDVQGSHSGTLIGGTSFGDGYVGEAFMLDGVDDAVTTQRDLPFDTFSSMTWECWVQPTRTNFGRQQIISIDDGGYDFSLLVEGNSYAVFTGWQSWVPPGQVVTPFQWDHLVAVFSPANVEFYLNGVRFSLGSPAVYGGSGSRLNIGRNPAFGEYFKGMIDEVSVYNRALPQSEILQLFASRHFGKCRMATSGPRVEISPTKLEFGLTTIGQPNDEPTLMVQNTGSSSLSASLAISNTVFSLVSPGASFTVPAGGSQVVKVRFVPTAATRSTGTLTLTHNDPSRPPIVIDLEGTGEPPAVCLPAPDGLVSWWRAEDFSAQDARGPNHGFLTNGTSFAPGKVGSGFSFTGATNYVDAPMGAMAVGSGDFTVEGWIKAEPGNATYTILSFGGVFLPTIYLFDTEGRLVMWPRNGAPTGTGFKDGKFHHFAVVRQGNSATALKYYKDGVLILEEGAPYDLTASRCHIGWDKNPGASFQGVIDDLSFYNRALPASEVSALFAARGAGKCFDPLTNGPEIAVAPATLGFDNVIVGSTATQNLTVSNSGVTSLTVSAGTSDNARFSVPAGTFPFSIAAGTNKVIGVQFSPTDAVPQSGTLTLANNDLDEASLAVPLSGMGQLCSGLPSGAVSWWRADTNALDSIGLNHGAPANGATFGAGFSGQAFALDGNDDRVVVPGNGLKFRTGDFTAEGWVKTTSVKDYNAIFTFDSWSPAIYIRHTGALQLYPSGFSTVTGFNDGQFHHFGVVRQNGIVTYYKDSVPIGTTPSTIDINPTFTAIGTSTHNAEYFPGLIDELTFYNRALPAADIAKIFAQGSAGKCGGTSGGTGEQIAVTPTASDFGFVGPGQSSDVTLTLSNPGTGTLVVNSFLFSNPRFSLISPAATSFTLAAGATQAVTLRFTPTAQGLEVGFLAFSNNSGHGTFYVPLRGIGATASRPRGGVLHGWGNSDEGQLTNLLMDTTTPFPLSNGALAGKTIMAVSSVDTHSLALDSDGKVYAWGTGDDGQLGDGTTVPFTTVPVAVQTTGVLAGKTVAAVAAGGFHSVALTTDGRVYAWGDNGAGQLGNDGSADTNVPVAVNMNGALAGKRVTAIAAANGLTLALASDGKVYSWGQGFVGQLGNGTTNTTTKVPVAVSTSGVLNGKVVIAIAADRTQAYALTSEGRVYAWGEGGQGNLGNGSRASSPVPVAVDTSGALNGKTVVAIAGGGPGGMALTSEGRVYDWGINFQGELGTPTVVGIISDVPVAVSTSGALAGRIVVGIEGGDIALALTSDGKAFTWGDNDGGSASEGGALGAGLSYRALKSSNTPVAVDSSRFLARQTVSALGTGYRCGLVIAAPDPGLVAPEIELTLPPLNFGNVAPGLTADLSLMVRNSGTAALTINSVSNTNPRFTIQSGNTLVLAPGAAQAVVVRFAPTSLGAQVNLLQINSTDADEPSLFVPMNGAGAPAGAVAIAWGENLNGELGLGTTNTPVPLPSAASTAGALAGKSIVMLAGGGNYGFALTATGGHSLALASDGGLYAWGLNSHGQLGNGTTSPSAVPVAVNAAGALAGKTIVAVDAGQFFSAALSADGQVFVWGRNDDGEAGNGTPNASYTTPVAVSTSGALAGKRVIAISCGGANMLALTADGKVFAWGSSNEGQLGDGTFADRRAPVAAEGMLFGKTIVAIRAGAELGLALDAQGAVYAWGYDSTGGTPGTDSGGIPIPFPAAVDLIGALAGKRVVAIAAGDDHSLALTSTGELASWGDNVSGQLGTGVEGEDTTVPVAVKMTGALAGKTIVAIESSGSESSFALAADGSLFAWGRNDRGQLGTGTICGTPSCGVSEPVAVNMASALAGKAITSLGAGHFHGLAVAVSAGPVANPGPDIAVTPANRDFGTITVNQINTLSVTVSNLGDATLAVSPPAVSNPAFALGSAVPFDVLPGTNHVLSVRFQPVSAGTFNGTLTLASNDPDEPSVVIALTGFATAGAVPNIAVAPTALNFGTNPVGQPSTLTLTVSNTGNASLSVPSLAVSNSAFSLTANPTPTTLAPGAGLTLSVRFLPPAANTFNGALTIASNDPNEPSVAVPLTGLATAVAVPNIAVTPPALNFGITSVGQPRTLTLTVSNTGNAALSVPSLSVNGSAFSLDANPTPTTLVPGAGLTLAVRFLPLAANTFNGALTVASNDPDAPSVVVPLSGDGASVTAPNLIAPAALDFGSVRVGTVADLNLVLGNSGNAPLTITALAVNNPRFATLATVLPLTIPPGGQATLLARFLPAQPNAHNGTLTITSNDPEQPATNISLAAVAFGPPLGGTALAWGANGSGQLGIGNTTNASRAIAVSTSGVLAGKIIMSLSEGGSHTLALTLDGKIFAWGENDSGQLGIGTTSDSPIPVEVVTNGALANKVIAAISAGGSHSLAATVDGRLFSWGNNRLGQAGTGTTNFFNTVPVAVDMSGALNGKSVTAIAAGANHNLVLTSDGKAFAWGWGTEGQLGNGGNTPSLSPVAVDTSGVLRGLELTAVAAGNHSLALGRDRHVYAWGNNDSGQLGNGTAAHSLVPVAVNVNDIIAIAAGERHSLALTFAFDMWSWGNDAGGQLGKGTPGNSSVPVLVDKTGVLSGKFLTSVAAGSMHTVAMTSEGRAYAWGANGVGELGATDFAIVRSPVAVEPNSALSGAVLGVAAGGSTSLALVNSSPSSVPDIAVAPTEVDFGSVAIGETRQFPLLIANTGIGALTITSLTMNNAMFTLSPPPALPMTLTSSTSTSVNVKFTSASDGAHKASLTIASNDPDEASVPVNLAGVSFGPLTIPPIVSGTFRISWPASLPNFVLQSTDVLTNPVSWVDRTNLTIINDQVIFTEPDFAVPNRFYRLIQRGQ